MNKVIAIVDGCSTGVLIAQEFNRSGFRCVHVQSSANPPRIMTGAGGYHAHEYMATVVHDGNLQETVAFLSTFEVIAVVPGVESGVELADALAAAIGVPCNHPALASARRDKYQMAMAVRGAGLRSIPTLLTRDVAHALSWIHGGIGFPVVVKPPKSGGTDGVTLCDNADALHEAFSALVGKKNILLLVNEALVVQPYTSGVEYIVDTVSSDGVHQITDIWEYGKRLSFNGASFVYDHAWLLPAEGETQALLTQYAKHVLDALGIRHGAAHCEIIMAKGAPVLIEVGARICGGFVPVLCKAAIGRSQIDALVESIVSPAVFKASASEPYKLRNHALRVLLVSGTSGQLDRLPLLKDVHRLHSFHSIQLGVHPGGRIERTTNFFSHPGKIDLIHANRDVLLHEMSVIRELEANGFYEVKKEKEGTNNKR